MSEIINTIFKEFESAKWYDNADRDIAEDILLKHDRTQPENKPLTLEQLRGMDILGWCWVKVLTPINPQKVSGYYQKYECGIEAMKNTYFAGTPGIIYGFAFEDYGKTWLAYRTKLEQEESK